MLLEIFRVMRVGVENIIVNFHSKQMCTKHIICFMKQLLAPNFFESLVA